MTELLKTSNRNKPRLWLSNEPLLLSHYDLERVNAAMLGKYLLCSKVSALVTITINLLCTQLINLCVFIVPLYALKLTFLLFYFMELETLLLVLCIAMCQEYLEAHYKWLMYKW